MSLGALYQAFSFSSPAQIYFGPGKLAELSNLLERYGRNVLLVGLSSQKYFPKVELMLRDSKKEWRTCSVQGEPSIASIYRIQKSLGGFVPDLVIAIGGGSVIDTSKVLAALATNSGDLLDYLEVVGKGHPLEKRAAPLIAIPTTAGTGSEVTRNAVLGVPEKKVKVSLRSPFIQAEIALIDPELTLSLPPDTTIFSGMDAFTQVIEPYVSIKANRFTDMLCQDGIRTAVSALPGVFQNGQDLHSRTEMSWVSLLGGLCLANAGLGAVHGFAAVIGGMFHAAHGAVCASLLPFVIQGNLEALRTHGQMESSFYQRYVDIFKIVIGKEYVSIQEGLDWFLKLVHQFHIPCLKDFGIRKEDFSEIIHQAKNASSMKANPVVLNDDELFAILDNAYER
jgi:alcohol dehydrogenase class IV